MPIQEIFILGVALSMDAFAVTISNLICRPQLSRSKALLLPVIFGAFQGLMFLAGAWAGTLATSYVERYAGLIALIILSVIGGRMILESIIRIRRSKVPSGTSKRTRDAVSNGSEASSSDGEDETMVVEQDCIRASDSAESTDGEEGTPESQKEDCSSDTSASRMTAVELIFQGLATSIDALIVGVSLAALGVNIYLASSIIATTTFLICLIGIFIGRRFGLLLGEQAQIVGGIILIAIGIHAYFF